MPRPSDPTEKPLEEELVQIGKHVLQTEGESILALSRKLGDPFVEAVRRIATCAGRVIVSRVRSREVRHRREKTGRNADQYRNPRLLPPPGRSTPR